LILRRGQKWFAATEFHDVEVIAQDIDQSVELLIGYGDYVEPPPDISSADFLQGYSPVTVFGGSAELLVSAGQKRKRVTVRASLDNDPTVGPVFINGNQADALAFKGLPLWPGDSVTFECRGDVYVSINGSFCSSATVYAISEEFDAPTT
jgi:hypothetical protein